MGKMKQAELVEEDVVMGVDTSKSQDSTGLQITFPGESAQKEVSLLQVIAAAVKDSTSVDVIERIIDLKNGQQEKHSFKLYLNSNLNFLKSKKQLLFIIKMVVKDIGMQKLDKLQDK
jgi:hypothetical protein